MAKELIKLAVVAVIDRGEQLDPSTALADFVIDGWVKGELAARISRLMARSSATASS